MATKLFTRTLTLPNGQRKYFRGKTQEIADAKYEEAKRMLNAGLDISVDLNLTELTQIWFDTVKRPHLKGNTVYTDLTNINNHVLQPFIAGMSVRAIRPVHIQTAMNNISHLSHSVQSKVLQSYRGIFDFAVDNDLIAKSPVLSTIKARGAKAEEKVPLTPEQTKQLLVATQDARIHIGVALMVGAGLRREEACGLMWEDIDLDNGVLHVRHALPFIRGQESRVTTDLKTESARRSIPLPLWLIEELRAEKAKTNSVYVLHKKDGQHLTLSSFTRMWEVIDRKGLDFKVHPHLLRHTCITRWVESGLDMKEVQYLAGHSTPEMTMRVYAHYDRAARFEATTEHIRATM